MTYSPTQSIGVSKTKLVDLYEFAGTRSDVLDLLHILKYHSLYHCYQSTNTPTRYGLYQKMHMIFIGSYFNKMYFVSFPYIYTGISNALIYSIINNHATVFCRKYKVIQ